MPQRDAVFAIIRRFTVCIKRYSVMPPGEPLDGKDIVIEIEQKKHEQEPESVKDSGSCSAQIQGNFQTSSARNCLNDGSFSNRISACAVLPSAKVKRYRTAGLIVLPTETVTDLSGVFSQEISVSFRKG